MSPEREEELLFLWETCYQDIRDSIKHEYQNIYGSKIDKKQWLEFLQEKLPRKELKEMPFEGVSPS